MSEPVHVDPVLSYARREGDGVRVVLVLRDADLRPGPARLRLRRPDGEKELVSTGATVAEHDSGQAIEALVPNAQVGEGTWRLRLGGRGPIRDLATRLVVRDGRPVALLPSFADSVVGN